MNAAPAIIRILLDAPGVQALVGDRVYGAELPEFEAQSMPRMTVVVTPSGGAALGPGARSYARWVTTRLDVFSYGKDPLQAIQVYDAVYEVLTQLTQTGGELLPDGSFDYARRAVLPTTVVKGAVVTGGPISTRDPDTDWPYCLGIYEVSVTPAT